MAKYIWNPNDVNTGVNPIGNGWTMRRGEFGVSAVEAITTPVGTKAWRTIATEGSGARIVTWTDGPTDAETVEVLSLQRRLALGSHPGAGNIHRGSASGSFSGYFMGLRNNATTVRGRVWTDGVEANMGDSPHGLRDEAMGYWVWIRSQANGSLHRVRAWAYGDPEPTEWLYEETQAAHASGATGFGDWYSSTDEEVSVAWFSVGTAGDPAPDTDVVPRKITVTDLKAPNDANEQVANATGVQVKLWTNKTDIGIPDVLVTDATITGGAMTVNFNTFASVGDPVLGVAKWEDSNETWFFPIETTVEEDV